MNVMNDTIGQGKFLISEPVLNDFYFERSVVLIADHNEEGSFGVIINKPVEVNLNEITKDFPDFDAKLYLGGPIKTGNLFYIHTFGDEIENSVMINDDLYWGGDVQIVKELMALGRLNENNIRFYIGYSGWEANQLNEELNNNSWVIENEDNNIVFSREPNSLWRNYMKGLGKEYAIWSNFPMDPQLN